MTVQIIKSRGILSSSYKVQQADAGFFSYGDTETHRDKAAAKKAANRLADDGERIVLLFGGFVEEVIQDGS